MSKPMPTPSADRLKRLQQMKRKSETISSAPMLLPENHLKKAKIIQELDDMFHWDKTKYKLITSEKRNKEKYVRYVHEENHKNFEATLCELQINKAHLGEDGNLNMPGKYKVTDPKKAKFEVSLTTGVPEKVQPWANSKNIPEKQSKCFKWAKKHCADMLLHAYHDDDVWKDMKRATKHDETAFLKNALTPFKTEFDEDDEEVEVLVLKRSVVAWGGAPNPIRLWKKAQTGEFNTFTTSVPRGSFAICKLQFKSYCFQKQDKTWMYGITAELGRDVVVIYMPKDAPNKHVEKALADVPFFD